MVQDDGVCCVRWDAVPNRIYLIEGSSHMDGPYTPLATKLAAGPGKAEYRRRVVVEGRQFFRVRVRAE